LLVVELVAVVVLDAESTRHPESDVEVEVGVLVDFESQADLDRDGGDLADAVAVGS
jgi:hypothetical protein